jgi:flagellar hook assembly protein FlgD
VPASGPVRLSFTLARPGTAGVAIHDVGGRLVREVLSYAHRPAGPVEVAWDGRDAAGLRVPAGLYVARLSVDGIASVRRLALLW